ncbi:immunity protein TriTu family protein [Rhizobium leguminosarum]
MIYVRRMSEIALLDKFVAWVKELAEKARSASLSVNFEICPPTLNPAAKVDFESSEILARITFWGDGSFHAEAIDPGTSTTILSRHGQALTNRAFSEEFRDVLNLVAINSPSIYGFTV